MATCGRSRILLPVVSSALALLALAGPSPATAQSLEPDRFSNVTHPSPSVLALPQAASTPSVGHLIVGGCLGSAVGAVAGSGIGYGLGGEGWDMLGFFGGSVVGSALGVKLAARHDGGNTTTTAALTGGLLGSVAGFWGPLMVGNDAPLVSALLFSLTQGTVAALWARSRTPR